MSGEPAPLLSTRGITRDFPGVRALDGVNFDLLAGEVHVVFGENGAGKSTLISLLSGANRPTCGSVEMRGERIELHSVHDARKLGISAVFQEFSLVPQMTVEENLFLGEERRNGIFLDRAGMTRDADRLLADLGFDLPPRRPVARLTRAQQQMVEIAKAFRSDLSVLILDEPTASLTDPEAEQLFALIRRLTRMGVGIIYITHRMAEIRRIADRVTVLRDARHVATLKVTDADDDTLVRLMTGREAGAIFPEPVAADPGERILELESVTTADGTVRNVTLDVRRHEIVGLAGLVGSGKSEVMQAAYGVLRLAGGTIRYKGRDVRRQDPGKAIRSGFLYLPADRKEEGLLLMRSARENMSMAALDVPPFRKGLFLDGNGERTSIAEIARDLALSPLQPERRVDHFSGGNQQKIMLARSFTRNVDLVVFDEPTVGVDVGTRAAIYRFVVALAESGTAVVVVSSDLPEVVNLATRVYVFHRGEVMTELDRQEISQETVLARFFGRGCR